MQLEKYIYHYNTGVLSCQDAIDLWQYGRIIIAVQFLIMVGLCVVIWSKDVQVKEWRKNAMILTKRASEINDK